MSLGKVVADAHIALRQMQKATQALKNFTATNESFVDHRGWLTDEGKQVLRRFYEEKVPANAAADILGISTSGVLRHYHKWDEA